MRFRVVSCGRYVRHFAIARLMRTTIIALALYFCRFLEHPVPKTVIMLKQILRDMHVDPEILAGLDDTQKQTLYCKMREEQIRRWRLWDQKHEHLEATNEPSAPRQPAVQFCLGADGEPWVWVMGEHENDRSIEEILADEAKRRARQLAEIETKELRKSYVAEMVAENDDNTNSINETEKGQTTTTATTTNGTQANDKIAIHDAVLGDASPTIIGDSNDVADDIYCTVDEMRNHMKRIDKHDGNTIGKTTPTLPTKPMAPKPPTSAIRKPAASPLTPSVNNTTSTPNTTTTTPLRPPLVNFNKLPPSLPTTPKPDVLRREITPTNHRRPAPQKISVKIALWENRVIGEKTNEIYRLLQQKQQDAAAEAEEAARKRELEWQEQECRAKVAEVQMRDIARKAREEHRKSIGGVDADAMTASMRSASLSSASSLSSSSLEADPSAGVGHQANGTGNNSSSPLSSLESSSSSSTSSSAVSRPAGLEAVKRWYRDEEFVRHGAGVDTEQNRPHRWFHGVLSRSEAELLLSDQPAGTFLVRLSDKIWGYAISLRDDERCKHYLVDASIPGVYQFLGANQLSHESLSECYDICGTLKKYV